MTLESLFNAWPLMLITLMIAIGMIIGVAAGLDAGSRFRVEWMGLFFAAVPVAMVVGVLIQGRVLGADSGFAWRPELEDFATTNSGSRIVTLLCLAVAAERVMRFILRQEYRGAVGAPLLWGFLIYVLAVNFISARLGSVPSFSHQFIYAPLFAVAMFAYVQHNGDRLIPLVRSAMFLLLGASLLMLAVRPSMVAETNYRAGLIASFGLRFYGFATHPNTLAPLCFVLMCALYLRPYRHRLLHGAAWATAWLSLVLTQSKTSIGLALVLMGVLWTREALADARLRRGRAASGQRGLAIGAVALGVVAIAALALLLAMLFNDSVTTKLSMAVNNAQFASLSGRTTIWNQTLKELAANPMFGYGPGLWSSDFQRKTGLLFTHAHNQYLQTLGAAGIVGLLALICFLLVLLRTAWQVRSETRGISVALAVYLLLRGLTEVPLSVSAAMQGEFLVQMFVLAVCIGGLRQRAASAPARATQVRYMAPQVLGRSPQGLRVGE